MPTYQIEMLWRCHGCDRERNRGLEKHCAGCGRPKSEGDTEYFPDDITERAALKGEAERRAKAGPDWQCKYCGSLQSPLNQHCTECGAESITGLPPAYSVGTGAGTITMNVETGERVLRRSFPDVKSMHDASPPPPPDAPVTIGAASYRDNAYVAPTEPPRPRIDIDTWQRRIDRVVSLRHLALMFACTLPLTLLLVYLFQTKIVEAHVTWVHWEHQVLIDRYQVWHREGWSPEPSAFNVIDTGPRFHHTEHVRIGSHTEHYTANVACGQSCVPQSCYTTTRRCTSNRNGTATCTGGDRICPPPSCTTKYCDESRTRTVDDYEDQPRYRDWYVWDAWDWGYNRTVQHAGDTLETSWPTEAECAAPLSQGEQERSRRESHWHVGLTSSDRKSYDYRPASEDEFERYEPGSSWRLKVGVVHGVEVMGRGK